MNGFANYSSPIGTLGIFTEEEMITKITFDVELKEEVLTPMVEKAKRQLSEYFNGQRAHFDLALNPEGTEFQQSVWHNLSKIPFAKTTSYSAIAKDLGDVAKVRAVGTANGKNPISIVIPCHRVIGVDGSLVGYAGGLDRKEWLLRHEGADIFSQRELFEK